MQTSRSGVCGHNEPVHYSDTEPVGRKMRRFALANEESSLPAARHMNPRARGQRISAPSSAIEHPASRIAAVEQTGTEPQDPALGLEQTAKTHSYRRKRTLALILTVLVVVAIPALILALVLLG